MLQLKCLKRVIMLRWSKFHVVSFDTALQHLLDMPDVGGAIDSSSSVNFPCRLKLRPSQLLLSLSLFPFISSRSLRSLNVTGNHLTSLPLSSQELPLKQFFCKGNFFDALFWANSECNQPQVTELSRHFEQNLTWLDHELFLVPQTHSFSAGHFQIRVGFLNLWHQCDISFVQIISHASLVSMHWKKSSVTGQFQFLLQQVWSRHEQLKMPRKGKVRKWKSRATLWLCSGGHREHEPTVFQAIDGVSLRVCVLRCEAFILHTICMFCRPCKSLPGWLQDATACHRTQETLGRSKCFLPCA